MQRFMHLIKSIIRGNQQEPDLPPIEQLPMPPPDYHFQPPVRPADEATQPSLRIRDAKVLKLYKEMDQAG